MKNRITLTGSLDDRQWVQAVMYFPTDKHLRESRYAIEIAKGELAAMDSGDRVELDKETLTQLIDAPSFEELKCKTVIAVKKGVVAGDILASIYLMHRFEMPEPSLKKAVHVAQRFAAKNPYGDSTPMNKSRTMNRKIFNEYKTVAHLWAAFRLNLAYRYADDRELFFEKLPFFLEVSAGLFEFGTRFIPYRAKPAEPILPPEGMWELPVGTAARHLSSDVFPSGIRDLLDDYGANEYQYKKQ